MSISSFYQRPLILSGPSGVGKSTLLQRLFADCPEKFGFSVSHTTRSPRPGEIDGKHYHFVSREKFSALVEEEAFIEHTQFSGSSYGTSKQAISAVQDEGRRCILDIEAQGVQQIKRAGTISPVSLFISPPSMTLLRSRLEKRRIESDESINKRIEAAISE